MLVTQSLDQQYFVFASYWTDRSASGYCNVWFYSSDLNIKVWGSTSQVEKVTGGSRENSVKSLFSQCWGIELETNQIWHGGNKTAKSDVCRLLLIPAYLHLQPSCSYHVQPLILKQTISTDSTGWVANNLGLWMVNKLSHRFACH